MINLLYTVQMLRDFLLEFEDMILFISVLVCCQSLVDDLFYFLLVLALIYSCDWSYTFLLNYGVKFLKIIFSWDLLEFLHLKFGDLKKTSWPNFFDINISFLSSPYRAPIWAVDILIPHFASLDYFVFAFLPLSGLHSGCRGQ